MLRAFRRNATTVAVALFTAALVGGILPAAAHVTSVSHSWNAHFQPKADARYYQQTQLNTSDGNGPNAGSNRVHWDVLNGVPAGFVDGTDDTGTAGWGLAGNAITAGDFLGTTNTEPLIFKANNTQALRLEASSDPNIIGGFSGNDVTDGAVGATIGGGGTTTSGPNLVTDDYGTVSGGKGNVAGDSDATTASDAEAATVGGGTSNTASGLRSTIGGGINNVADDLDATVGGGSSNAASGSQATVGGGTINQANGTRSTVGGGFDNRVEAAFGTIAGGARSTAGDANTRNIVTDEYGTIGGGGNNQAGDGAVSTTNATFATIGGGQDNTASGVESFIGGGDTNSASSGNTTVGGGESNDASASYAFIGGGLDNTASGQHSTIGGGTINTSSGSASTVGGGTGNFTNQTNATIAGGHGGNATGFQSTVGGGFANTASSTQAMVGGGGNNVASAETASVPGGAFAAASLYGQMAHASGSFGAAGLAQTSEFVLRNTTTSGTQTKELFLDGVDDRLTLAAERAMTFEALIVGRTDAGETAGYMYTGLIERTGTSTSQFGFAKTVTHEEDATWDVTVSAEDVTFEGLKFEVTGDATDDTRWVAMVQTAEVLY